MKRWMLLCNNLLEIRGPFPPVPTDDVGVACQGCQRDRNLAISNIGD
jgi:hypothetical protein